MGAAAACALLPPLSVDLLHPTLTFDTPSPFRHPRLNLQYLQRICGNVQQHPEEPKYRKVGMQREAASQRGHPVQQQVCNVLHTVIAEGPCSDSASPFLLLLCCPSPAADPHHQPNLWAPRARRTRRRGIHARSGLDGQGAATTAPPVLACLPLILAHLQFLCPPLYSPAAFCVPVGLAGV